MTALLPHVFATLLTAIVCVGGFVLCQSLSGWNMNKDVRRKK